MHDHGAVALTLWTELSGAWSMTLLLLFAGLWGGVTHCAGMCGPFVFAQVDQSVDSQRDFGRWQRLKGAALVPYQLGRLTTYAALGGLSGGLSGLATELTELRWIAAGFLVVGAALFAAQALGSPILRAPRAPEALGRLAARLTFKPSAFGRYALGVVLGFLPCGLLYGALATSAAAGGAVAGAVAMAAFAVGTVPALMAVGWGGMLLGARRRQTLQRLTRPMLAANALVLLLLAVNAVR